MDITEVRIKLMDDPHDRLQAFCSITLDGMFVIRDLKIIQGAKGSFVAMPSRKLTDRCPRCYTKNHLRAQFCNQCGVKLDEGRATKDSDGRAKLYADIAHPINSSCREQIQRVVIENFELEKVRAQEPGYVCTYDDFGEDSFATLAEEEMHMTNGHASAASNGHMETNGTMVMQREEKVHRIDPPSSPSSHHNHVKPAEHKTYQVTAEREKSQNEEGFGSGLV
ncbi:MAG: SpoVG family protein [Planctomycetaceae bacterium]